MQQIVNHRWFTLADLILVFSYGAVVMFRPQIGGWLIVILLIPWGFRLATGRFIHSGAPLNFALALILITAGIGIWAAYDRQAAWEKFWIIIGAIVIFATLINQPKANLGVLAGLVGLLGVIIAIIFLFNNDWTTQSTDFVLIDRAGKWIMAHRLSFGEINIRPNFVGGILAIIIPITTAYAAHSLTVGDKTKAFFSIAIGIVVILSLFLTSSRAAWMALILGLGAWIFWRTSQYLAGKTILSLTVIIILIFSAVIFLSVWIIASYPGGVIGLTELLPGIYGWENRSDLRVNTSKLIGDYPFTGGGLQSFPGLYSQYIMVTPYFLLSYSHNFYLDVILEQGFIGGLAILVVIIGGAAVAIKRYSNHRIGSLSRLLTEAVVISTLIILLHGIADDPLYGEFGSPLLLLIPGIALAIAKNDSSPPALNDTNADGESSNAVSGFISKKLIFPVSLMIMLLILVIGYQRPLLSNWYANLGAVEMSRNELQNWPHNKWNENPDISSLKGAQKLFNQSLDFSPNHRTAWHRLGLISMQRRDFESAQAELENAFLIDPEHRGIRKSLGYAYVWGDRLDQANQILIGINEAKSEMEVYTWWWNENDRLDLSSQANDMVEILVSKQQ
ncbi:MAG: hypothetical protein JSW42_05165 [Chloroflexota bacterium]|nr:MAG: hypothetical protein JSW42_05165 [Chloroflexota bacterium]